MLRALADKSGTPLQCLSLADNELGMEACGVLTDLVARSSTLTYLDASCNDLTIGGIEQGVAASLLSAALRRTSPLTTLCLAGNELGPPCALEAASALATNSSITALDMRTAARARCRRGRGW